MRIRRSLITMMVNEVLPSDGDRQALGYVDPFKIAEALEIKVHRVPLDGELSGFLVHDEQGTPFIGVNSNDPISRQRFTIAHELGHYFLHDRSQDFVDQSAGRARLVANRDELSREGIDAREIEANLFAAELLMPAAWIIRDIEDYSHADLFGEAEDSAIRGLADKYKVSLRAMTIRLERLGFISEG